MGRKRKNVCPICKYGYRQEVMIGFKHTREDHLKDFALVPEKEMVRRGENSIRDIIYHF